MNARDTILRDIRRSLGRTATEAPTPPRVRLHLPQVSRERRIASMLDRVTALAGKAFHASCRQEADDYVTRVVNGAKFVVAGDSKADCAAAKFGIGSADYALSDTGSLVMIASADNARLVSLLPPVHIAIVPADRLLTGLDELYTLVPKPADRSSSTVFITGPSRTADIEQILVRGVHGPGELHVVIVD